MTTHDPYTGESDTPTQYAVQCRAHGLVYLTEAEYNYQLARPDDFWKCPRVESVDDGVFLRLVKQGTGGLIGLCDEHATFDDDVYENSLSEWAELDREAARDEAAEMEFDLRREERDDYRGWND